MKNIVLLGASNSVLQKGLYLGLQSDSNIKIHNLALGATDCIQRLYELIRNKKLLKEADLIIVESNVTEINLNELLPMNYGLELIYRDLNWLYKELYFTNKNILAFILPRFFCRNYKIINNIHKNLILKYGFNFIDMSNYYEKHNLIEFSGRIDPVHPPQSFMRELGKNIIQNLSTFKASKTLEIQNDNPQFVICTPKDMKANQPIQAYKVKNSMYDETNFRLKKGNRLYFDEKFQNFRIIAVHTWNLSDTKETFDLWTESRTKISLLSFFNTHLSFNQETNSYNAVFNVIEKNFLIDENTFIGIQEKIDKTYRVWTFKEIKDILGYCDLIAFFLAKNDGNFYEEELNFELLENENIDSQTYDYSHLIPPIALYKEIIDEYCLAMDNRKLTPLQNQIKDLQSKLSNLNTEKQGLQNQISSFEFKEKELKLLNLEQDLILKKLQVKKFEKDLGLKFSKLEPEIIIKQIKPYSAKARIENHLAYKLGRAMIINSRSFLGILRMPYVLSYIKEEHQKEQEKYNQALQSNPNLKLPPLEDYEDYEEALKIKNYVSYKLGEALIKAYKNKWGGGIVKFLFYDVFRIKKEFKKRKGKK